MSCGAGVMGVALAAVLVTTGVACSRDGGVRGGAAPDAGAGSGGGTNLSGPRPTPTPLPDPPADPVPPACGPTLVGPFEGRAIRLDRAGDLVYVADGYGGLVIF